MTEAARVGDTVRFTFVGIYACERYNTSLCAPAPCRMNDAAGQQYELTAINDQQKAYTTLTMPNQAHYQFTLSFEGLPPDIQQVELVELAGFDLGKPLEFRNIPVPYKAP